MGRGSGEAGNLSPSLSFSYRRAATAASQAHSPPSPRQMASPDSMLYIKEDLIIPNGLTFYELIINKARGKSGPLFHFDVHEVRCRAAKTCVGSHTPAAGAVASLRVRCQAAQSAAGACEERADC